MLSADRRRAALVALTIAALAGWCEQAWAQALPPRIVQCSGGGFFTRVAAAAPPATEGKAATLGQLSVCCTTSVVVDGYGDLRAPCVDLGSGGDNANATAAGACSSQQIVVAVAAAIAGAASGPVDVTCAPLSPPPAEVLGHIATTFDGSDLTGLAAFPRRLQRAAANALELLSAAAPAGVPVPANISAAGTLEPCSTRGQPAVTADVQCQGVAEDVCACVGDAVRCVPAGTGLVTLPGFVTADDLRANGAKARPPWCRDSDDIAGWLLLKNTTSQLCKAAPAGASGLVDAECDGASRAQRWRVAAAPAEAGGEQESAAQVLAQDSRLEAAVHAGQCAYLGTSGELQFGECVVRGKAVKTRGAQAVAGPDFALSYSANLTLQLQPLTHALRTWQDDYAAVRAVLTTFRPSAAAALPAAPAATTAGATMLGTFRTTEGPPSAAVTRTYAHCAAPGVLCNGAGRVVHVDVNSAAPPSTNPNDAAFAAETAVGLVLGMPLIAAASWRATAVRGQLPRMSEIETTPPLLRSLDLAQTAVSGALPPDWPEAPSLALVNLSGTALRGPLPATWLDVPTPEGAPRPRPRLVVDLPAPKGDASLCLPARDSAAGALLLVAGGPASEGALPLCESYTSWSAQFTGAAACKLAEFCPDKGERVGPLTRRADSLDGSGDALPAVHSLACSAQCAATAPADETASASEVAELDAAAGAAPLGADNAIEVRSGSGNGTGEQAQRRRSLLLQPGRRLQQAGGAAPPADDGALSGWGGGPDAPSPASANGSGVTDLDREAAAAQPGPAAAAAPLPAPAGQVAPEVPPPPGASAADAAVVTFATTGAEPIDAQGPQLLLQLFPGVLTPAQAQAANISFTTGAEAPAPPPLPPLDDPVPEAASMPPRASSFEPLPPPPVRRPRSSGRTLSRTAIIVIAAFASVAVALALGLLVIWCCGCSAGAKRRRAAAAGRCGGGGARGDNSGHTTDDVSKAFLTVTTGSTAKEQPHSGGDKGSPLQPLDAAPPRKLNFVALQARGAQFRRSPSRASMPDAASAPQTPQRSGSNVEADTGPGSSVALANYVTYQTELENAGGGSRVFFDVGGSSMTGDAQTAPVSRAPEAMPEGVGEPAESDSAGARTWQDSGAASPTGFAADIRDVIHEGDEDAAQSVSESGAFRSVGGDEANDDGAGGMQRTQTAAVVQLSEMGGSILVGTGSEAGAANCHPLASQLAGSDMSWRGSPAPDSLYPATGQGPASGSCAVLGGCSPAAYGPTPHSAGVRAMPRIASNNDLPFAGEAGSSGDGEYDAYSADNAPSAAEADRVAPYPTFAPDSRGRQLSLNPPHVEHSINSGSNVLGPTPAPLTTAAPGRPAMILEGRHEADPMAAHRNASSTGVRDDTRGTGDGGGLAAASAPLPNPVVDERPRPIGEASAPLQGGSDGGGSGGGGDDDEQQQDVEAAAAAVVTHVKNKVQRWFAEAGGVGARAPAASDSGAAAGPELQQALDAQVARVRDAMPAGYAIEPPGSAVPAAAAAAAAAPPDVCRSFALLAESRPVGCVLVCASEAQRDELSQRARHSTVFPPRLGLIAPDAAAALCFSCGWSLDDTLAERRAASEPLPLAEAAATLLELCRVLEELHLSGYASGGLTPGQFVKGGPVPRSHHWHLNCLHTMLPQGSAARAGGAADPAVQWLAPEAAAATGGTPRMVDAATDMFVFGLIAYEYLTGRSLWKGLTEEQIRNALVETAPMPALPRAPTPDSAAAKLLPIVAQLLQPRMPARPLAGEVTALLRAASDPPAAPAAAAAVAAATHAATPPRSPRSDLVSRHGTQPLRLCLAFGKAEAALGRGSECVRARLHRRRRVFQLERGVALQLVLFVALADTAAVPVYPLRSTSHFLLEWGGHEGQVVEVAKDEPLHNGRARLLSGEWDAAPMCAAQPTGSFHLHVFAQVLGFDDPIKISKRVQYESVEMREPRASRAAIMRPILDDEAPAKCSTAAQAGGIEFEAHIPLSQAALAQLQGLCRGL